MPVTVVVGGQFGSEGKGKTAAFFSEQMNASIVIRCGGSNSGHTVYDNDGKRYVFRQLPTACLQPHIKNVLASGTYIDVEILLDEINKSNIKQENLHIDPYAVVISKNHKEGERASGLTSKIGSTGSGTGYAVRQRVDRSSDTVFAKDLDVLQPYLSDTKIFIHDALKNNERIIIEGTQGFGLSLLHSDHYPYVTSRDTTAAGFISECGVSPLDVDDIVLVIRAFPIRVAGKSGPLTSEINWHTISSESGGEVNIREYTSVTHKLRRVGRFDPEVVKKAILVNKPTRIVLNHLDYVSPDKRADFVKYVEDEIGTNLDFIGESVVNLIENQYGKVRQLYVAKN